MKKALLIGSWVVVLLCALGLHPALRDGAPLAPLSRQIAEDAARAGDWLDEPLAFWALNLSLLYIAGWSLVRLSPSRAPAGGTSSALLIAALAGQVAASFASSPALFYVLSCGIAALALFFKREPAPPPVASRPWGAWLVGLVVVLLASPLDSGLASLTGAAMLPEAWFPLAVELETRWPVGVTLSVGVLAACWAVGRSGHWLGVAPACVLVFGPSNPAKGLAAAAVIALLARSGASPLWRSGFLAAVVAAFAAISILL